MIRRPPRSPLFPSPTLFRPRRGPAASGLPPRRAPRRGRPAAATPPPSPGPRSPPRAPGGPPAPPARGGLGARPLLSLKGERERLLTLLAPGVELVGLEALLPRRLGLRRVAGEPVGPAQLVVGLDQVGPELERLLEEGLRVLVHLALQVHEPEVEVSVQGGLLVVVQADRLREMLDGLAEDLLLQADVPDVDAGE